MVDGVSGNGAAGPRATQQGKLPTPTASKMPAGLDGRMVRSDPARPGPLRVDASRTISFPDTAPRVETRSPAMVKEMAARPPVDSSRVATLRAQVSSGTYRLDADRTAAAMIRHELGTKSAI